MIVSVQKAVELIRAGEVVALPTETVYGLAADASNLRAVQKIFELKRRPADNPLIVHISNKEQAELLTANPNENEEFQKLSDAFWPGPLTMVVTKKPGVLDIITAGLETVAIRMPDHPDMLSVIDGSGPVAAPSANRSGRPSPTRPNHVLDDFGTDLPIVDGGTCTIGIESTVLDLTSGIPTILRPGKISADEIKSVLSREVSQITSETDQSKRSPGTRYSHYQPNADVRWMEDPASETEHQHNSFYIYHSVLPSPLSGQENIISFDGNFDELARSLYDLYRMADKNGYTTIFIEPLPEFGASSLLPALANRIHRSVS